MGTIVFPPCQREGCTETGHHWHDVDGSIRAHLESTCAYPWSHTNRIGCVDTHEPAAIPEPEPDPRVGLLEGVCLRDGVVLTRSDAAMLLSIADAVAPTNH